MFQIYFKKFVSKIPFLKFILMRILRFGIRKNTYFPYLCMTYVYIQSWLMSDFKMDLV